MITFSDGPASGQHLMLKRAPFLLRVSVSAGIWDALDQPDDIARPDEKLYAYKIDLRVGGPTAYHILTSPRDRSGFYCGATYRIIDPQPDDRTMRSNAAWSDWCEQFRQEWEEWNARAKETKR